MWQPDILGEPWVSQTVELPPIRGNRTVTTLVSQRKWLTEVISNNASQVDSSTTKPLTCTQPTTAILYIHGLNDYFFQTHLADHLAAQGVAFFAIDLHGFGRSTTDEKTRNDAQNLREYGNDLAYATHLIKNVYGYEKLVLLAHSTGGLIASLWAHSRTGRATVDGLMLNSPWFDLNRPWIDRTIGTAVLDVVGPLVSDFVINNDESNYVRMLHKDIAGEWDFDLNLKREVNSLVRVGFIRAVREGQARLAAGLNLEIPILVITSDRTGQPQDSLELKRTSDVVLDVQQIIDRAPLLGKDVEIDHVTGGIHDLALSELGPRTQFFNAVTHWLRAHEFTPQKLS